LERARAEFFLSIRAEDALRLTGESAPYRAVHIDKTKIDFTDGFTALHTVAYQEILAGKGFGIDDAYPATEFCAKIRADYAHR